MRSYLQNLPGIVIGVNLPLPDLRRRMIDGTHLDGLHFIFRNVGQILIHYCNYLAIRLIHTY